MEKIFEAPGRIEICGNHTDHQHGCVLAGAVNLESTARVVSNGVNLIRIFSQGYAPFEINVDELSPKEDEKNTTAALVRGVAGAIKERGYAIGGFDAYVNSTVLPGSGLSSSAAFEVLMGRIFNSLFCADELTPIEIAEIGQYAENVYFGKPCGLMDQAASSVGGLVFIDFKDKNCPYVERIDFDFEKSGYNICIVDVGADHANLTEEYAAIPDELSKVCAFFSKNYLRELDEGEFYSSIASLRKAVGDRAVLRAIHVFDENKRVVECVNALKENNIDKFLKAINGSALSSQLYLQNVIPSGNIERQDMALALALCKKALKGRGALRVHGGGFAGTALAFVPNDIADSFKVKIESILGEGSCRFLTIGS